MSARVNRITEKWRRRSPAERRPSGLAGGVFATLREGVNEPIV